MSCFNPSLAVDLGVSSETGKHKIKFLPKRPDFNLNDYRSKWGDSLLMLPCGHCLGCQFDTARDWAVRCYCESLYHDSSSFLTLTYDERHLPKDKKVHREHITGFIKDLRNRGIKCRYFGCGEYGSTTARPHYHLILFGFMPDDLVLYSKSNGFNLYSSDFLSSVWNKGFVVVGDCTYETASYVARYTTKKLGDDKSFLCMSNRPGIGADYCYDHAEALLRNDKVYGNFGIRSTSPIPRYFNNIISNLFPDKYIELVKKRVATASSVDLNRQVHYKTAHKEVVDYIRVSTLMEKLERIGRL